MILKKRILTTAFALVGSALISHGSLQLHFPLQPDPAGGTVYRDTVDPTFFFRARPTPQHQQDPQNVTDIPAALQGRLDHSVDIRRGMLWLNSMARAEIDGQATYNLWVRPRGEESRRARNALLMWIGSWQLMDVSNRGFLEFSNRADRQVVQFPTTLKADTWYMLTLVTKDKEVSLYLDGKRIGSEKLTTELPTGTGFYIGTADSVGNVAADITVADFSIFSSPLQGNHLRKLLDGVPPSQVLREFDLLEPMEAHPFTEELITFEPRREVALLRDGKPAAAFVQPADKRFQGVARRAQKAFTEKWGVQFPLVTEAQAKDSPYNLIIIGDTRATTLHKELAANLLLEPVYSGYDLRTIPQALDWEKDILVLGIAKADELDVALNKLFEHFPQPTNISHFVDSDAGSNQPLKSPEELVKAHEDLWSSATVLNPSQLAIPNHLKVAAEHYRRTGDDAYVAAFNQMQRTYLENARYSSPNERATRDVAVPYFELHIFPQSVWLVEQSPAYTKEDQLVSAEIMRQAAEALYGRWAFGLSIKGYQEGRSPYLTNHYAFASRSMSTVSRYLLSRYSYKPAMFWKAAADHGLDGLAPHPYSPEDAGGYQFLSYAIFMDYAIASGRYGEEFFQSSMFRNYINDTKKVLNHLGWIPGYGDANAQYGSGAQNVFQKGVEILGDEESEYLLNMIYETTPWANVRQHIKENVRPRADLPPPGLHTHGFNWVRLVPFKMRQYGVAGLFENPLVDKAVFRSGWDKYADYLALNGINDAPHGHFEANAILQYIHGNKLWIFDGHYIRKYPEDQNSITVNRNGVGPDHRFKAMESGARRDRVSQLVAHAQTGDRTLAGTSMLLEDYAGLDWTRHIGYQAKEGFWVIDELVAREDGEYAAQSAWRMAGRMVEHPGAVMMHQADTEDENIHSRFSVNSALEAPRYLEIRHERSHGRKDSVLIDSEKTIGEKLYANYVRAHQVAELKAGESIRFVHYFKTLPGHDPQPVEVRKTGDNLYSALDGSSISIAIVGDWADREIDVKNAVTFISRQGLVSLSPDTFQLSGRNLEIDQQTNGIALSRDQLMRHWESGAMARWVRKQIDSGKAVAPTQPQEINVPKGETSVLQEFDTFVTALAGSPHGFAVGTMGGETTLYTTGGEQIGQHKSTAGVNVIQDASAEEANWLVGYFPERVSSTTGDASIRFLNATAEEKWKQVIPYFNRRNGTPMAMTTARLKEEGETALIVGSENNYYYAFDRGGNELWKHLIVHGATAVDAGDMTGDGLDEIAAGGEYYDHAILDAEGKQVIRRRTSPWNECVVVTDINGDGLQEAFYGRSDGYIYAFAPTSNPIRNWSVNAGGRPVAIISLVKEGQKQLAVATGMGDIVFIDKDGARTGYTRLPGPLTDIILQGENIYAACMDGHVYQVAPNGDILRKWAYSYEWSVPSAPKLTASGDQVAVSSGTTVWLLK